MADISDADIQKFAARLSGRESPLTEEQQKQARRAFIEALSRIQAPTAAPTLAPVLPGAMQSMNSSLRALPQSAMVVRQPRDVEGAVAVRQPAPIVVAEEPTTERFSNKDEEFVDEFGVRKAPWQTETRR